MKTKQFFALLTVLAISLFASTSHATDITATNSGNWSDITIWNSGTVPGATDDVDVPFGINVTVDTNVTVQFIYDLGTVTMAANSSLNLTEDAAIDTHTTLVTTAPGNTVIYSANPFGAKQCNYYNLVLVQTNYVQPIPPYGSPWQDFNNFSIYGPTPMTIAGDMTLIGTVKVQQGNGGAPITIGGNLIIGSGCAWDCSGDVLTVVSNVYVYGLLEDLNGALGSNYIGGNVIVAGPSTSIASYPGGPYTNGWYVSDVITWYVGGSLTNNGSIFGWGYGSISFNGTGIIAGSNAITIPTMVINGTYAIGATITLSTNAPTINGTVVFDIARTNQIVLNAGTNWLWYTTNGTLNVINSGAEPAVGNSFQLFKASNNHYGGGFASISLPLLSGGHIWVDNLLTSGSIAVANGGAGSPIITLSQSGGLLTLSWDSTTFPGYRVQAQTNSAGIGTNWSSTGSGTNSPFTIAINPANPAVFFRLSNP